MKYFIQILIIYFFSISCSTNSKKNQKFHLTTLNDYGLKLSKNDSIQINQYKIKNKKLSDSCNRYKLDCLLHGGHQDANFKGGINNFRQIIYDNFKIPLNTPKSKNRIYVLIGRNDKIKSYNIEAIKDQRVKNELIRILNLDEINNWKSGSYNQYKLEYFVELDLIIE